MRSSFITGLRCMLCGHEQTDMSRRMRCDACGGYCQAVYDLAAARADLSRGSVAARRGGLWRFRELLPVRDEAHIVTLAEGGTPLLPSRRIGRRLGLRHLFFKDLTRNPTSSFKDYSSSTSISKAREIGIKDIVLMSAGNASSSFAAYCSLAGIRFHALMLSNSFEGMVIQNLVYGPDAAIVEGDSGQAGLIAADLAARHGWMNGGVPSNPYRVEGKKVIGFEIAEALDWAVPDRIICPTAGGTSIMALDKAFRELEALGWTDGSPKLDCIQSVNCPPVVDAWRTGEPIRPARDPQSVAIGLLAPNPEAGPLLVEIMRRTGGSGVTVDDDEIRAAQLELAREEGLFVEASSAAALAGLTRMVAQARVSPDERIVLMLTGAGLKSPEVVAPLLPKPRRIDGGDRPGAT
jgi:threonine synthase